MRLDPIEKHKRRILLSIKVEEAKKDTRTPKPPKRVWKHRYSIKKYAGRYLPWEQDNGNSL